MGEYRAEGSLETDLVDVDVELVQHLLVVDVDEGEVLEVLVVELELPSDKRRSTFLASRTYFTTCRSLSKYSSSTESGSALKKSRCLMMCILLRWHMWTACWRGVLLTMSLKLGSEPLLSSRSIILMSPCFTATISPVLLIYHHNNNNEYIDEYIDIDE